ncbi:MAG: GGDEF domain-containing protein, partial [Bacillota bacterium]|nr:GGDEF domain-containing protein [Bacillota bacterium]
LEFIKKIQNGDAVTSVNFLDYNDIKEVLKEKNLELVIDQLTGAYNRKFIDERLLYNLSFFQNHNKYFSLVLCDIDYFKDVNDKYGHLAGDYVLKWFVSQIKTIIRKDTDWVARYGGDEFIIYLDNIDMDSSVIVINKIRNLINFLTIFFEKEEINITSSFGITKPKLEDDFNSIIKRVDEALYISKTTGRNKVSYL